MVKRFTSPYSNQIWLIIIAWSVILLTILLLDNVIAEKEPVWSYKAGDSVYTVDISSDGEDIVAGSYDEKFYVFNKNDRLPMHTYSTEGKVYSVAITPSGEYIAAGNGYPENNIYLVDNFNNSIIWNYSVDDDVKTIAISSNGGQIIAGADDRTAYFFDDMNSTPSWSYLDSHMRSATISANGEYLAIGTLQQWDGKVHFFQSRNQTPQWSYRPSDELCYVSISPDGNYLIVGTSGAEISLFHKNNNTPIWSYEAEGSIRSVAFSDNGEYIAVGSIRAGGTGKVYLFNKDSNTTIWDYNTDYWVNQIDISSNGKFIVAGDGYYNDPVGKVYFFNKDIETPIWSYTTGENVRAISISANGEYIVAGTQNDMIILFERDSPPLAHISSIVNNPALIGENVKFYGYGTDDNHNIVGYQWNSSVDGTISTYKSFATSTLSQGNHIITLRVKDGSGNWSDENASNLVIHEKPVANIVSVQPDHINKGEIIYFIGNGSDDGTIMKFQWNSSIDGVLSYVSTFQKSSLSIGNHTISLRVQDNNGKWSDNVTSFIKVNIPPEAIIDSITETASEKGKRITFLGRGYDTDGYINKYLWSSSIDGTLNSKKFFNISDLSLGNHIISFSVADERGVWSEEITDRVWIYTKPVLTVRENITVEPGHTISFSCFATDEDGTVVKYEWDFDGDGIYDKESTKDGVALFAYNKEGTYNVEIRVTDNDGFSTKGARTITVKERDESLAPPIYTIIILMLVISISKRTFKK